MKLKAELCTVRTSCKRHARELVLAYYAKLSSNIDIVLEWSQQNSALIPASTAGKKDRLIKLYCKAKIADLTGIENQEQKAKFIYDLSKLVSCLQLFDDAAFDIFIIPACWLRYSPVTTALRSHTAIPSSNHLLSKLFSRAMVLVEQVVWSMLVQQDLVTTNPSIQSRLSYWGLVQLQ